MNSGKFILILKFPTFEQHYIFLRLDDVCFLKKVHVEFFSSFARLYLYLCEKLKSFRIFSHIFYVSMKFVFVTDDSSRLIDDHVRSDDV